MAVQSINISPQLAHVLNRGGENSGVDFDYLVQTAVRESSLNPTAKASTSTATGLFQFIENTWFDVIKSDGTRLGYGRYSDAIVRDRNGDWTVNDPKLRSEVLKLREDPAVAADMAGAFTKRNGDFLLDKFGRMPSPGELYIAHFLGADGAAKMFEAGLSNPDQIAADLFPRPARSNPSIFYSGGKARTIKQVYQALVAKHGNSQPVQTGNAGFAAQQAAEPIDLPGVVLVRPNVSFSDMYRTSPSSATAGNNSPVQKTSGGAGLFNNLYSK